MKALMLKEYNRFEYQDMPEPQIAPGDVLIQVKACGICGSDVHGIDGSTGRRRPPIIMGHEAAGIITQTGENVNNWQVSDRVTFDSTIYCGSCRFCRNGQINLCDNRRVLGVSCDEYRLQGAFAEYVVVPQRILYRLPDKLSFEHAAMVEPLSIAVHAVQRTTLLPNDVALVVGAGMIGLLLIQTLGNIGCGTIIAVDLDQARLDLAHELGADICLRADTCNVPEIVQQHTAGRGADIAFEVVGLDGTINTALQSLRKGGTLTLIGNISPTVEMPLQTIVTRELLVKGSCASCGQYPTCLEMIAKRKIKVDPLISAIAPLKDGPVWFQRLYDKQMSLLKVILTP